MSEERPLTDVFQISLGHIQAGWHINDPDGGYVAEVTKVRRVNSQLIVLTVKEADDVPYDYPPLNQYRPFHVRRPMTLKEIEALAKLEDKPVEEQPKDKKIYTVEEIREKLENDWEWQRRALLVLFSRQTQDEQKVERTRHDNDRGFSAADAKKLSSFARQLVEGKKTLSWKQMYWVKRMLPKYAKQLHELAYKK